MDFLSTALLTLRLDWVKFSSQSQELRSGLNLRISWRKWTPVPVLCTNAKGNQGKKLSGQFSIGKMKNLTSDLFSPQRAVYKSQTDRGVFFQPRLHIWLQARNYQNHKCWGPPMFKSLSADPLLTLRQTLNSGGNFKTYKLVFFKNQIKKLCFWQRV